MNEGNNIYDVEVNTNLSIMKSIHARWVIGLYDRLRNDPELIKSAFKEAGISETVESIIEPADPPADLD